MNRRTEEPCGSDQGFIGDILLIGLVAAAARAAFALAYPEAPGDGNTYLLVAHNILDNGCISLSDPAGGLCVPSWGGNQPPGLAAFAAFAMGTLSWLFGDIRSIGVLQAFFGALAIVRLAFVARSYGIGRFAVLGVGLVLALSPLQVAWARLTLTESLSIATTTWVAAELLWALHHRTIPVPTLGLALVAALSIRYDAILLAIPVAVVTVFVASTKQQCLQAAVVGAIVVGATGAWALSSMARGLDLPPPGMVGNGGQVLSAPAGYKAWINTWLHNEYEFADAFWPVLNGNPTAVRIPDRAYSSEQERQRVRNLLDSAAKSDLSAGLPPRVDEGFGALARERHAVRPWERRLISPVARSFWMMANPFTSLGWPSQRGVTRSARFAGETGISGILVATTQAPLTVIGKGLPFVYRLALYATLIWLSLEIKRSRLRRSLVVFGIAGIVYWLVRLIFFSSGAFAGPESRYLVQSYALIEPFIILASASLICSRARD